MSDESEWFNITDPKYDSFLIARLVFQGCTLNSTPEERERARRFLFTKWGECRLFGYPGLDQIAQLIEKLALIKGIRE